MTEFQRRLEANISESLRFAVGEVQDDAVAHMVAGVNAVLNHPCAPAPHEHVDVEDVARRIYEDAHRGMSNIWAWDDRGLDDEHPGTRERYLRYAQSAIDALAPPPQTNVLGDVVSVRDGGNAVTLHFAEIKSAKAFRDTFPAELVRPSPSDHEEGQPL